MNERPYQNTCREMMEEEEDYASEKEASEAQPNL